MLQALLLITLITTPSSMAETQRTDAQSADARRKYLENLCGKECVSYFEKSNTGKGEGEFVNVRRPSRELERLTDSIISDHSEVFMLAESASRVGVRTLSIGASSAAPKTGANAKSTIEPIPLEPARKELQNKGKVDYVGTDSIAWQDALTAESEVVGCKDAECYLNVIKPYQKKAYESLDIAFQNLSTPILAEVHVMCASEPYPRRAACINNYLYVFAQGVGSAFAVKRKNPEMTYGQILEEKFNAPLRWAALMMCKDAHDTARETCLENALTTISRDARVAGPLLNASYKAMSRISVQSALCETGAQSVFGPPFPKAKKGKSIAPRNWEWQGLGDGACHASTLGKDMIPPGPFGYTPDTPQTVLGSSVADDAGIKSVPTPPQSASSKEQPEGERPAH